MVKAKVPNYDAMSLADLNAAAAEHYDAIRELRESGDSGLTVELAVAEHRAHLAVINPLRTELGAREELQRSSVARIARGMTKEQWAALHQAVSVDEAAVETAAHEQSAG